MRGRARRQAPEKKSRFKQTEYSAEGGPAVKSHRAALSVVHGKAVGRGPDGASGT